MSSSVCFNSKFITGCDSSVISLLLVKLFKDLDSFVTFGKLSVCEASLGWLGAISNEGNNAVEYFIYLFFDIKSILSWFKKLSLAVCDKI